MDDDANMAPVYAELAAALEAKARERADERPYIVAVAGCPSSGKSTLAARVRDRLLAAGVRAVVVPMDGYHFYRAELDAMEDPAAAHRFRGAPFTFNAARLVGDLASLRAAGLGSFPSFDHAVGDPVESAIRVELDTQVVLVEGNYLLLDDPEWAGLRSEDIFDETWMIRVPLDVACDRLTKRHMRVWSWDEERARHRVMDNDYRNMVLINDKSVRADREIQSV
jgi:pantothenate kinase